MKVGRFVARSRELAMMSAALIDTPGEPSAILFVGEPGIGKTRLLREAEDQVDPETSVILSATGCKAESRLSYAGLHYLLSPLLGAVERLPTVQRVALMTALGLEGGESPDPLVVSLAALNLITEVAKSRCALITIDDIQWLDADTRHTLAFVARRVAGQKIGLIATASAPYVWNEGAGAFLEHTLSRLEGDESSQVLREHAPGLSEAQREWILQRSLGNPLALLELSLTVPVDASPHSYSVDASVPLTPALVRAFAGDLEELSDLSRDAILVAALAFEDNLQEILAATSAMSKEQTTAAIFDRPVRLGFLTYDENRVVFRHPLVKSAVSHRASASRRYAAHRALGEVITVNSRRRTWHRASGVAGRDDLIATELEAQGWIDVRRANALAALALFQRAADLSSGTKDRGRRLLLAAKQAVDLGRVDDAARLLAIAVSGDLADLDRSRADLLSEQCGIAGYGGTDWLNRLCASVGDALTTADNELALDVAVAGSLLGFREPLSRVTADAVRPVAEKVARDSRDVRSIAALGLMRPIERSRDVASALGSIDLETIADTDSFLALARVARAVGDYRRCSQISNRAECVLRANGLKGALAQVLTIAADVDFELGHWRRGAHALTEAFSLISRSRSTALRAELLVTAAKAAGLQGDPLRAMDLATEAELSPCARSGSEVLSRAQIARGIAYIGLGKHVEATSVFGRVFDSRDPSHHPVEQFSAVTFLAEAAVRSGQPSAMESLLPLLMSLNVVSGSPVLQMQLHYARAVLAADDIAEDLYVEGLASDFASFPWPRARLQLAYGRWLRRHRQSSRSRGPLSEAVSTFTEIGATRWAQEASDELSATARRSHDGDEADPGAARLSTQELKIAQLAAEGLSNTEIGQLLSLSPRTVGSHLYRVFPKLEISSRRELAARLALPLR
jgi:DNA-binding CsgD family transcriptional regulator